MMNKSAENGKLVAMRVTDLRYSLSLLRIR